MFLFILLVTQELFWSLGPIQSLQVNAGIAYNHPKLISYLTYIQGLRWDEGFLQQAQGPSGETPSPKPARSFTTEQPHPGLFIWASENLGLLYFLFFFFGPWEFKHSATLPGFSFIFQYGFNSFSWISFLFPDCFKSLIGHTKLCAVPHVLSMYSLPTSWFCNKRNQYLQGKPNNT